VSFLHLKPGIRKLEPSHTKCIIIGYLKMPRAPSLTPTSSYAIVQDAAPMLCNRNYSSKIQRYPPPFHLEFSSSLMSSFGSRSRIRLGLLLILSPSGVCTTQISRSSSIAWTCQGTGGGNATNASTNAVISSMSKQSTPDTTTIICH
jgi:hypothetical protein